jgi:proteasome lid subunit RPN8/RPN11
MTLRISHDLLAEIWAHGEAEYPDEGAGLMLGMAEGEWRTVATIRPIPNAFEPDGRYHRYRLEAADMLAGELEAERLGLDVVGVFHSHPDHPAAASEFDREWALPWYSYLITNVRQGRAVESRSWRLTDDRCQMVEEVLDVRQILFTRKAQ